MSSGIDSAAATDTRRLTYQPPSMKVMSESELLVAFQMSAARISAAGCWWTACNNSPVEEAT